MSKWGTRDGILARHAGHALLGIDSRSVVCTACGLTLLLDANREVRYDSPVGEHAPQPAEHRGPDAYGRRPCCRCGKRVTHDSDGDPHAHAVLDDPIGRPCVRAAEKPATLPPGGWRELVASQQSETSP